MENIKNIAWVFLVLILIGCDSNGSGSSATPTLQPANRTVVVGNSTSLDEEQNLLEVYIPAGLIQCRDGSGLSFEEAADKLILAGIDVVSATCGTRTDVMYAMVCGGETGDIYLFQVRRENLPDAEGLGFRNLDEIGSYKRYDCF